MLEKFKENKVIYIILIIITIAQVCAMVYAASKRRGYHIDEFYSHGLIQYDNAFIINDEDFYNEWHNKEYFQKYLTVKPEQLLDLKNVYKNQILDVHPPMYYLLLRIFASFNLNNFSQWPGTILNIILFIFSTIVLYKIGNKLFDNKYYSVILCLMNGFCIGVIETVIFIRMYQLTVLNILLLVYWHLSKKDKKLENKDLIQLAILVITGFLTHYYYAIVVAVLYFMYIYKYIKNKEKSELIKYTMTMIIAVLSAIIIFPYCVQHIFFGYRGQESFANMERNYLYIRRLQEYGKVIVEHVLANAYQFFIIIVAVFAVEILISAEKRKKSIKLENGFSYIFIPTLIFTLIVAISSVYIDFRYIMPVIPLYMCLIVYILKSVLECIMNKKAIYVLTIIAIIYCALNIPKVGDNLYTIKQMGEFIDSLLATNIKTAVLVDELLPVSHSSIMTLYDIYIRLDETYVIEPEDISSDKIKEIFKGKELNNGVLLIIMKDNIDELVPKILESEVFKEAENIATTSRYEVVLLK